MKTHLSCLRSIVLITLAAVLLPACTHKVEVDVKHVAPIEANINVNLKIERDLESYFAYEAPDKYPLFATLKAEGKIGEVHTGYVEAVDPAFINEQVVKTIVEGVNKDRAMIYGSLAKQKGLPPENIAMQNAQRNFASAPPGAWLKTAEGWKQKS